MSGLTGCGAVQEMEVGPSGSPCREESKPPQAASVKGMSRKHQI
jgi:hypothetical protein